MLDDSDTRFLDSFFDGVSSDQYLLNDPTDNWNYEWQDLPPDFLGTTSSFGQQIEPVTNDIQHLTFPECKNPLGLVLDPDACSPSKDVLAAATLLRNGQHSSTFMTPVSQTQSISLPFSQSMTATEPTQSRKMPMRPEDYLRHTSISEAIYSPSFSTFSSSSSISKKVEIKWGTDSSFANGRRFVAPPNSLTVDEIEESMVSALGCFQPGSNSSTRPSSPVGGSKVQPYDRRLERIAETASDDNDDNDDNDAKSRKRKKAKAKEEEYEDEDVSGVASKIPRKRRPKSFSTAGDSQANEAAPQKRRKSAASAAPKMTRENLTEDQKRENHIRSEQKRRTLIKEGFEDLNDLVPDLRGGGFSKSAVLIMAADWLEDLISCNRNLKVQLAELEHRHGI